MNHHHFLTRSLLALSLFASSSLLNATVSAKSVKFAQTIPRVADVITSPTLKFDKANFEATLRKEFTDQDGKVTGKKGQIMAKGFAVVLIKNGQIVHEFADGLAVDKPGTANDVNMTTSTPTNVGSSFKTISAISLLNYLEKNQNAGISVDQSLDKPFWLYLPQIWQDEIKSSKKLEVQNIKKVTIRQLLQHKSGFCSDGEETKDAMNEVICKNPPTIKKVHAYLQTGIESKNMGKRNYENVNITLLTYILPNLVDPSFANTVNAQVKSNKIAANDYNFFGKRYGDYFEQYLQSKIFNKITPTIKPSCDPEVDYGKINRKFALGYSSLTDEKGTFWSEKKENGGCHAQGGYYLSTREFAAFMANYSATETLISQSLRQSLYNTATPATRDNRIVWSGEINSPFITKHFKVPAIPYHGGTQIGYKTAVVQFPDNYIAVAVVNSEPMSSRGLAVRLKNAWGAGMENNFK